MASPALNPDDPTWISIIRRCVSSDAGDDVKLHAIESLSGGFSRANVFKVLTSAGPFVLRGEPLAAVPADLFRTRQHWLKHLEQLGVPVPVARQERQVAIADRQWHLEPFLPGSPCSGTDITEPRLAALMTSVTQMHNASAAFQDAGGEFSFSARLGNIPAALERWKLIQFFTRTRLIELKDKASRLPVEFQQPAVLVLNAWFRHAREIEAELHSLAQQPCELFGCVRDLWSAHLLWTGDEVTGIIDPHVARVDHFATDLSRLLGSYFNDHWEQWRQGIQAYEVHRSLTDFDKLAICVLDRSAVLLSGMNWLWRLTHESFTPEQLIAIQKRFSGIATRSLGLATPLTLS